MNRRGRLLHHFGRLGQYSQVAEQRIFPALDIAKCSTRREEFLLNSKDIENVIVLRRALTNLKLVEGARRLVELLEKYPTDAELLNR